jgi:hypothetical protein
MQQLEVAPRPENFPLGTPHSRAAARSMLKRIQADREKPFMVVTIQHIGTTEPDQTIKVYAQSNREIR